MKHLAPEEVLIMHARLIEETGGLDGVRDIGLLISACERPKATFDGKELYKTVFVKSAAILESLARGHVFLDGNKRTAFAVVALFLQKNGYELAAKNKEVVKFMLQAAVGELDLKAISSWLKEHCQKVRG